MIIYIYIKSWDRIIIKDNKKKHLNFNNELLQHQAADEEELRKLKKSPFNFL